MSTGWVSAYLIYVSLSSREFLESGHHGAHPPPLEIVLTQCISVE